MAKTTNHAHIRVQQVKIYKNTCFVFDFTLVDFLTVFPTAILTGSWWRRKLKWNSEPSFNSISSNFQFQENRIETVVVTVPPWLVERMAVLTSSNMLMSLITNAHNDPVVPPNDSAQTHTHTHRQTDKQPPIFRTPTITIHSVNENDWM